MLIGALPPVVVTAVRALRRWLNPPIPVLEYCPGGWDGTRIESVPGWDSNGVVVATRMENEQSFQRLQTGGPLGIGHQHNLHVSFAYVLARVAFGRAQVSILDWGGGLGYYYYVARAAFPDLPIEYCCKETAVFAEAGSKSVPSVSWYNDESCLTRSYDLVMLSGSLQYAQDWQEQLRRIVLSAADWLYITRVPVIEREPTFAAVQRVYGSTMLHWQFNRDQLLQYVKSIGFGIEREFETGDRPFIQNAPEQCELRGWLFRRVKPQ